jgi:hypothetical protein
MDLRRFVAAVFAGRLIRLQLPRNDEIEAPDSGEAASRQSPVVPTRFSPDFAGAYAQSAGIRLALVLLRSDGMLRIITEQRGSTFLLDLHGTVADEGVGILERHWRGIVAEVPSAGVRVGLSNVVFIDTHGERLLRRMSQCGVTFDASGCMNRYVIERIEGGL